MRLIPLFLAGRQDPVGAVLVAIVLHGYLGTLLGIVEPG